MKGCPEVAWIFDLKEATWQSKGLFQSGRAEMDGFPPGTVVWVRVRTVGLRGVMGAWSDPGQIRAL